MDQFEMKKVKVELSTETEEFYLAYPDGWHKAVGFKVVIEDVAFSIVPVSPPHMVRISDVESGLSLLDMEVPDDVISFEETIEFLGLAVVPKIFETVDRVGFQKYAEKVKAQKPSVLNNLGPMPKTEKVDTEWLRADISDTLN